MKHTVLTQLASVIAVIASVVTVETWKSPAGWIVAPAAIIVSIAAAIAEVRYVNATSPQTFRGEGLTAAVRQYMINLLRTDGRCVMSSNDLTWATGAAKSELLSKARGKSLELLMPAPTAISEELRKAGAEVHYYGNDGEPLRSRFTIINHARADAYVAIGSGSNKEHTIRLIDDPRDPVFHLASDLVDLAQRAAAQRDAGKGRQ